MKKIEHFTRDLAGSTDQLAESLAAEPGVIWQLEAGEDYEEGAEVRLAGRLYGWGRKHGMKARVSIPKPGGTVEVRFSAREGDA